MREEEIERLRGVVRDCVSKHLYSSAIFFADKVAAFTNDPADIYMQAQALFLGRHYRRAFHLLNASKIVLRDLRFRYLAAKCLEELKEWDQCLLMLGEAKVDEHGNVSDTKDSNAMYLDKDGEDREINISSAICFLRGKAHEALENRAQARLWYKAAIKADPLCYEALECLIENHMLTCEEEANLISSLQFGNEDGWLSSFYSCLIKKYEKENVVEAKFRDLEDTSCKIDQSNPSFLRTLKTNTDLLACKAEYYHQCGEYQKCFELTSVLLEKDPFHNKSTLVHLAAAMELGHSNELYLMACNLVKDYPQKALSWFAVGCYYYCIKKYDQSRRYFSKATSLDGTFAPAWIGFGNAYAAKEEGDQAMSAYRTAARLFPGCHLPTLYIGMECMRTHSYKLAEQFFLQAKAICPSDPLVFNELGVVAYHMQEYNKAVWWFEKTLALIPSTLSEMWEPTVVNLAHACRKLKMYDEAISYYEKALALSTRSVSTYAGLAYTYHLQATSLDGTFAPAWIGFGNAYAAKEEGDQAMSAYRTAARLFPGCHLPTLYIGMECMRTHSYKLAEQFFLQAKAICPSDPLVFNELGVVAYHMQEYNKAVWWFEKTLALIPSTLSEMWEPTVVNLAHACRKLKMYDEAISYYEKALALSTRSVSTYAGLAYTYHLQDDFATAITYYHKALWLKPDDQFCTEMLSWALMDESRCGVALIP